MDYWYEFDTFTLGRRKFRADTHYDDSGKTPWEDDCIYEGVVSDWTRRDPEPHERILHADGSRHRLFDGQQYIKVAISHGRERKQAAAQLEQSFEHVKDWCNDGWQYVGVRVRQIGPDGEDIEPPEGVMDSMWGIEDCDKAPIHEVAKEIAEEIIGALEREAKERRANATKRRAQARGMVTA